MEIDSEMLKDWLMIRINKNTIHFPASGEDYITSNGVPYKEMYDFIEKCEKAKERD